MASEWLKQWLFHLVCLSYLIVAVQAFPSPQKVQKVMGAPSSAPFTEPELGQVTVLTQHGTPVKEHHQENQDEDETETYAQSDWDIIEQQLIETGNDWNEDTAEHPLRRRRRDTLFREKRFSIKNRWYVWPKGIVPYDFNMTATGVYYRDEALAAMTRWQKYTCIRFVPWVPGETMARYGLTEESHVTITKGKGCSAHQGNIHRASGQYNSCCRRGVCIHELGHTLGLWHEHQSPWREDIIKLDRSRVPGKLEWTYKIRNFNPGDIEIYQYDTSNRMHYKGSAFRILYEDLKPLIRFYNTFYTYKDVSLYHKCEELHCANVTMECHNSGFLTLVDDQCSCLCPPGLDPSTGCTTTIRQITTSTIWPAGSFALFSTSGEGCPGNGFQEGSWQHEGKGGNRKSDVFHLAGSFGADVFRYEFCVRDDNSASGLDWEPGRYCILRVNGACPRGFEPGSIQFDDAVNSNGQAEGRLPDGQFTGSPDTRLEFCCRDDGYTEIPLQAVPNTRPFMLLMTQGGGACQEVAGMRWTEEYMWFDSYSEQASMEGRHPYVSNSITFNISFCYYVPANLDCGGEITLTKDNPQAVISSPNFPAAYGPNMECNWLIKAGEAGGQVLLNFDVMEVSSNDGQCRDSLELRYNLPGQPGVRYCGDGLSRTIRSLNNMAILTLRTDGTTVISDIGFNLTAALYLPEEEGCYEPSTRGRLYRGQKSYTRGMKACLPWTEVTHCLLHAFHPRDFGSGLDQNYCRNPDNTAMPWCYTDLDCNRDFCDVCNIERIFDRSPLCPSVVCEKSAEEIVKAGCVATCGLQPPAAPDRDALCEEEPVVPADARYEEAPDGTKSAVGETVTFRCSSGSEHLNATCLSDGHWSPVGYVCGACNDGWAFYKGSCYRYFWKRDNFAAAQQTCAYHGALVSSMKNEEELKFVSSLRRHLWNMWIGATDKEVEGEFRWEDGSLVDWFNWDPNNTPNNYRNQDCVEAYTDSHNVSWNDLDCGKKIPFVCKYSLSERTLCADRHADCRSVLLSLPDTCTQQPDFALQMCPYSCGLCLPDDTPQCTIRDSGDVIVVRPQGHGSVARGAVVQYACQEGFVLTGGQLVMACGPNGAFIGTPPVCQDPETIIQDSNDVDLIQRPETTSRWYSYTSLGSHLAISRTGVIKQWKFYSPQVGFSFFQVWRPNPQRGNFSFILVGQSQVLTAGQGEETYDLQEADWIPVQPGDRIGLYETGEFRGFVPYTNCNKDTSPADFGVTWSTRIKYYGDFSPSQPQSFSSDISCRTFSFKAIIHPVTSVPAQPDMHTSDVALVSRPNVGSKVKVYLGDSSNFYIPADGYVMAWQFYVKHGGSGAFQVWRRREDKGERKYQLIGQNEINITTVNNEGQRLYTLKVPEGERIAAKAGDIIGFLYGEDTLGISYSFCNRDSYPESDNIHWFDPLTPDTAIIGDVYSFGYSGGRYLCRVFSFRAIVEQTTQ